MRWQILVFALAVFLGRPAIGSDYGTELLGSAFQTVAQSIDVARATKSSDLQTLVAVRDQLNKLEGHLNKATEKLPDEYKDVFSGYDETLAKTDVSLDELENLLKDISAKNQFFERTAGFWPFDKGLLVVVKVSTYRADKLEPGYSVAFTPQVDADRPDARFPFSSDTNNASRRLPPGNYVMFLSRKGDRVLSRSLAVGADGTAEEDIRIVLGDGQ
ncbi:hypothetical protein BMW22_08020 [Rhizobium leguminosarum]|uniref:Uncharacterized protein n=1 Tax=Rhizobium leguminosarum TaxID=384 RepID=A0A1L3Z7K1_RHILE|nr:hypothetical protein [Rhizobium leguminosarum]API51572.1 hypothetical protein BMW22_08020 [Rhizobium leguminosarum]